MYSGRRESQGKFRIVSGLSQSQNLFNANGANILFFAQIAPNAFFALKHATKNRTGQAALRKPSKSPQRNIPS
jgi:hypothetical protein